MVKKLPPPLPIVEGVAPSFRRLPAGAWKTVLDFLTEKFPNVETETWQARMKKGEVADETGARLDSKSVYRAGACVFYYREPEAAETRIPFEESILFRDENLLAADKPHFLPVIPAGRFLRETLLTRLRKGENLAHLVPLHRLDRETAGIVLFSVNPETRGAYASLFNDRKVEKIYHVLAGNDSALKFPLTRRSRMTAGEPFFRMREAEGEPNSETRIELVEKINDAANLYRLKAVTGKKHQIRLHLAALGIPIVNDKFYPEMNDREDNDFSRPLKLLAKSVSFPDPITGEKLFFESERSLVY